MLPLLLFAGCAAPVDQFNATATVEAVDGAGGQNAVFLDVFERATTELRVVLPRGMDTELSDALIAAHERGVDVLVATDVDAAGEPAVVALVDGNVPVRLGDGPVGYFDFASNLDVGWSSDQVMMTSAFAVADRQWFAGSTSLGHGLDGTNLVVSGHHEDLADDLWTEHVQLFGGSDATALTSHSAPAKSIADVRWRYGTGTNAELEMWLGPQERLTKRVIDAVYGARQSVWIVTDDFANEGLAKALQEKAADGFDVQVIVGPRFGASSSLLSRELEEASDVAKFLIADAAYVPTVVIIDAEPAGNVQGKAMFLTHDLYSAARLYRGTSIVSDQMIDGVLWQVDDWNGERSAPFEAVRGVFDEHLDRAGAL